MRRQKSTVLSEVNITSLVDVTLVLLIVFIIAAPLLRAGIKVDLPRAEIRKKQQKKSILIIINRYGQVYFDHQNPTDQELEVKIRGIHQRSPNASVLIEGDNAASYGRIVAVMDAIRRAGYQSVGLVLEEPEG